MGVHKENQPEQNQIRPVQNPQKNITITYYKTSCKVNFIQLQKTTNQNVYERGLLGS